MAKKQQRTNSTPQPSQPKTTADTPNDVRLSWHHKIALLLAAVAALTYVGTLGHGYVLDDPLAIGGNEVVKRGFAAWPELLTTHYRQGTEGASASALLYRPLSLMAFAAEWSIMPNSAGFGHFMNVLYYALATGLVFLGLRRMLTGYHWWWAAGAALLFAIHPIHTEVVANIKSRDEIFVVLFGMLAFYGFARRHFHDGSARWGWISLGAYFLALLSKESAVMLWPVFGLAAWFFGRFDAKKSLFASLPYLAPVVLFLVLQRVAFAGVKDASVIDLMDNPIIAASGWGERSATGFAVLWQYIRLLVVPHPLLSDYSYTHFALANWTDPRALLGLGATLSLLGVAIWGLGKRHPLSFCIWAFGIGMILYSQLPIVIGTLLGERLAFGPSVWWCMGMAWLIGRALRLPDQADANHTTTWALPERGRTAALVFGAISLLYLYMAWVRSADWKDNLTLFTVDSAKAPNSVRLHNGVSGETYNTYNALPKERREAAKAAMMQRVEQEARAGLAIRPNPISYINVGNAATVLMQWDTAVAYYKKALEVAPNMRIAKVNLTQTLTMLGRKTGRELGNLPGAAKYFEEAVALGTGGADLYLDLGTVYGMMGRNADAIAPLQRATQLDPNNKDAWRNLSAAYAATGNAAKAAEAAANAR
jgi:protein O-mannosyl-transferase